MLKKKRNVRILKEVKAEEKENAPKKVERNYVKVLEDKILSISDTADLVFGVSQVNEDSDPYIDIRTWLKTDKYNGPTKKGLNFNREYLDEFIELLLEVRNELDEMKL